MVTFAAPRTWYSSEYSRMNGERLHLDSIYLRDYPIAIQSIRQSMRLCTEAQERDLWSVRMASLHLLGSVEKGI